ncbi:MAG: thioredoxin family protein [Elusimicrobiota bacterium]|jgi:small redox-active disulfide protein 2
MKIEVFGPGCPKCVNTEKAIKAVLAELKLSAEVVKITDISAIVDRGVMFTPAVIIDGKKVCEGKVPTPEMIKGWLK